MNKILLLGASAVASASIGLSGCASATVEDLPAADPNSQTPHIDRIRAKLKQESPESGGTGSASATPYLDAKRKELAEKDQAEGKTPGSGAATSQSPYIDQLRQRYTELAEPQKAEEYIPRIRQQIGEAPQGGAIAAVHEGRSELHPKYVGEPTAAFGLRYGVSLSRDISGSSAAVWQNFNTMYGTNYAPELTLFYDRQLLRQEGIGSLGLAASLGVGYFHGNGNFQFPLAKPDGTGNFSAASQTMFQFFELPLVVGASARLSALKYVQPYAIIGPSMIGYVEMRNDKVAGNRGFSEGLQMTGGAAILLDWISASERWNAYTTNGIHHTYLTVEYTVLTPLAGDVSFSTSGLTAGVTFEY